MVGPGLVIRHWLPHVLLWNIQYCWVQGGWVEWQHGRGVLSSDLNVRLWILHAWLLDSRGWP